MYLYYTWVFVVHGNVFILIKLFEATSESVVSNEVSIYIIVAQQRGSFTPLSN